MNGEDAKMAMLLFSTKEKREVIDFINIWILYLRLDMGRVSEVDTIVWVLGYVQRGSAKM